MRGMAGVGQLTRYPELLDRDPLLAPVKGRVRRAGDEASGARARQDRGIDCLSFDYAVLKGADDPSRRLC
jgi:hypothetical protein